MEASKPARLGALTGLRCFAAVNIVLFHFSNPQWFGPLAPVVNAGYISVSFFILLSGFVLAYNYAARAREGRLDARRFWLARLTRLYPIYLLSLMLGWRVLVAEQGAHTPPMFWLGVALTPLLLQGWVPEIATFWNTPAWTMSAEAFFYLLFPLVARWRPAARIRGQLVRLAIAWTLGMVCGALYVWLNPDGLLRTDRFSYGPWLQALKFTPLPHLGSFLFGVLLAGLDGMLPRASRLRLLLGGLGFTVLYGVLWLGLSVPYPLIHDGLLMPVFACMILGLAGENGLAKLFAWRPLVFVGESSYCLYLLHFNLWNLIHDSGILKDSGLASWDPWISYALLIAMAMAALYLVEKPAQRLLRRWLGV